MLKAKLSFFSVFLVVLFFSKPSFAENVNQFTRPFLIYYGGGDAFRYSDFDILAKFDVLVLDRFRYKKKLDTWNELKKRNAGQDILIYQMGPEVSNNKDDYQAYYLNNIGRYNVSRGHPKGDVNNNNTEFFLLDKKNKRIPIQYYPNNFLLDFGNEKFIEYWLQATYDDIVDREWAADGVMVDNALTYYASPIKKTLRPQPIKYNKKELWNSAMNYFVSSITKELHKKKQKVMVNRGNSRYESSGEAWEALDNLESPPDYVLEEGAFAVSWGLGSVQFLPAEDWKRQIELPNTISNSSVAMLSHTDIGPGETGIDNFGKKVTFEQIFFYAFGSYHLARRSSDPLTLFSFDYSKRNGSLKRISWFDIYGSFDLGEPVDDFEVIEEKIYLREFTNGYVYVNPTGKNYINIAVPENVEHVIPSLNGKLRKKLVNKFDINSHSAVFFMKKGVDHE